MPAFATKEWAALDIFEPVNWSRSTGSINLELHKKMAVLVRNLRRSVFNVFERMKTFENQFFDLPPRYFNCYWLALTPPIWYDEATLGKLPTNQVSQPQIFIMSEIWQAGSAAGFLYSQRIILSANGQREEKQKKQANLVVRSSKNSGRREFSIISLICFSFLLALFFPAAYALTVCLSVPVGVLRVCGSDCAFLLLHGAAAQLLSGWWTQSRYWLSKEKE